MSDVKAMKAFPHSRLDRCRWVLCNDGDAQNPDVRARLVACKVNYGSQEDSFYAATPPPEVKKILFAKYAHEPIKKGVRQKLIFVDIIITCFNAIPKRHIFMSLPRKLGLPGHTVAKQIRCVYGTRDAGALWADSYREAFESMEFRSDVASPCIFHHADRDLTVVVHGDDFTRLGNDTNIGW